MKPRLLVLRRAAECAVCEVSLPVGATAWWNARAKEVTCATCYEAQAGTPARSPATPAALDRGQAGASAERERERRRAVREAKVREAHPRIGDLVLKVRREPQREAAFRSGQLGELAVGAILDKRDANGSLVALHDRRMPGGRGNIDHLAVCPSGVFVIDAKQYSGKVRVDDLGFRGLKLTIAERDRTKLVDGLERQMSVVRDALATHGHRDVPVRGVLCFTTGKLPRFTTLEIRGQLLLTRRGLGRRLDAGGPLEWSVIEELAYALAAALPGA
jgi:hypothetical protein